MTAQNISYRVLLRAIRIAFTDDSKIFELFDPHVTVKTVDEVVENIDKKIIAYEGAVYSGIYEKGELVGYFVKYGDLLVSFALNSKYRTRHYLKKFFRLIREDMPKPFLCLLWSRNVRAIKYLFKNGMRVDSYNNLITRMICQ